MNTKTIEIQEHEQLNNEQKKLLSDLTLDLPKDNNNPKYLGLSSSGNVGYYIGAKWIKEKDIAIVVNPKIDNLNYLKMFIQCFNNPITAEHVSRIYGIDFEREPIELSSIRFELTPFIIIHFLNLVKKIVKKGLKRDYVWVQTNLNSKIKGKLLIYKNIKQNTMRSRPDRIYCKYQEYSQDCFENRLIKRTLDFILTYLKHHYSKNKEFLKLFYFDYIAFSNISSDINIYNIKQLKTNLLYKEYNEALKIAKIILKHFNYSIYNTKKNTKKYPPFHIDMSLLFELYVYSKLYEIYGKDILFQYHGKYGYIDFLHVRDKTIIDTKYKEKYSNEEYEVSDIRQLSAYSRDINVLKKVGIDINTQVPILDCVIIYPNQNIGEENIDSSKFKSKKIDRFYKFYKYGIKLPEF